MTPFQRINEAQYGPGKNGLQTGLRVAKDGSDLPNARFLSTYLSKSTNETHPKSSIMSVYVMQMGQFLDHDFAHSPNNAIDKCCTNEKDDACIDIEIFANDTYFGNPDIDIPDNRRTCMPMARAMCSPGLNCELDGTRQQVILFIFSCL